MILNIFFSVLKFCKPINILKYKPSRSDILDKTQKLFKHPIVRIGHIIIGISKIPL